MLDNLAKNKNKQKNLFEKYKWTGWVQKYENLQIEEAQQTPTVINTKKSKVRYFMVNMLNTKERKNLEGKSKRKAK